MPTTIRPTSASCPPGTCSLPAVAVAGGRGVPPARRTDRGLEGRARPLLKRLHELFGREDRLVGDRANEVARLQPGFLGRGSARDRADLRCELRPHSELPRFFRLAEDRIAHGDEA